MLVGSSPSWGGRSSFSFSTVTAHSSTSWLEEDERRGNKSGWYLPTTSFTPCLWTPPTYWGFSVLFTSPTCLPELQLRIFACPPESLTWVPLFILKPNHSPRFPTLADGNPNHLAPKAGGCEQSSTALSSSSPRSTQQITETIAPECVWDLSSLPSQLTLPSFRLLFLPLGLYYLFCPNTSISLPHHWWSSF